MQIQRINISLPTDIIRRLQTTVPAGKRSRFITKALSEKLAKTRNAKKELKKSLKINYEFYKKESSDWKALEIEGWPK